MMGFVKSIAASCIPGIRCPIPYLPGSNAKVSRQA